MEWRNWKTLIHLCKVRHWHFYMFFNKYGLNDRWRSVWFEGVNKELEHIINTIVIDHIHLGNIILYIQYWMSLLSDCLLGCVNRERNMAAYDLSKHSMEDQSLVVVNTIPPFWLVGFLYWSYTI